MQTKTVNLFDVGFPAIFQAQTFSYEGVANSPHLVKADPSYVFDNVDLMRLMVHTWNREWERDDHRNRKGIMLFGPTGCGKSSFFQQFFARLGVPVVQTTATPKREMEELIQKQTLIDGCLLPQDQALIIAARNGFPFLIHEIDAFDPAELLSINDIIETGVIPLPDGSVVQAKRGFVVFATSNTSGMDDPSGAYHGTRFQNIATLRRFFCYEMDYPSEADEAKFLAEQMPEIAAVKQNLIAAAAKAATMIRKAFKGTLDGKQLSAPISRPEIVDWIEMLSAMSGLSERGIPVAPLTISYAFSARLPKACQETVREIIENCFAGGSA